MLLPTECQGRTVSQLDAPFSEANSTDLFKLVGTLSSRSALAERELEDFKRLISDFKDICVFLTSMSDCDRISDCKGSVILFEAENSIEDKWVGLSMEINDQ